MGLFKNLLPGAAKALGSITQTQNALNRQLFASSTGVAPLDFSRDSEDFIEDGFRGNPDVYSVVSYITGAASAVPPVVLRETDSAKAREYKRLKHTQRNGASDTFAEKAKHLKEEAFEEVDPEEDLVQLIERPNPLQAFPEFLENILGFKLVTGDAYIHGVELNRTEAEEPIFGELWPMPPQLTRIVADKNTETLISSYVLDAFGTKEPIDPELVLHLKYWNPDYSHPGNHLYGQSPLKALTRALRVSNDGWTAMNRAFLNNGAAGMLFPKEDNVEQLSEQQQREIESHFRQHGAKPENYKSVLTFSAEMGWKKFGVAPVDLEILKAEQVSMRKVCNAYNFPSELLNDPDNKTQANKRQSRKQLYQEVVIPELERAYEELNRWLRPRFGDEYMVDYDVSHVEALQPDMSEKSEWLSNSWWLTANEKRKQMGFEPIEGFDEPYIPSKILPASVDGDISEEEGKWLLEEYTNGNYA